MTNLGKSREELIFQLFLSLNQGNVGSTEVLFKEPCPRVELAIKQYRALEDAGIIREEDI